MKNKNNTKNSLRLISWEEIEKEWMQNPAFVREWKKVEPEYQLARQLIGARLKRKLTQAQLAAKINSKQPVISRIEGMSTTASVSLLQRIADALDMRLDIKFIPR